METRVLNEEQLEQVEELLKGFNEYQVFEIIAGLKTCGANVAIYANTEYMGKQMRQIRLGLEKELDVSFYADPKFNWKQMWQIREGLRCGLNVSLYADPKYDDLQMEELRLGARFHYDFTSAYADPRFDHNQMHEILIGQRKGLDVSSYANPELDVAEMQKIRGTLERNRR
ncbi:MAG: hypothetical protein KIB45_05770 [Negativicoccus succinicivorans]|uniref:hypothetical protein n=1 Tax=Negativicoccus succinicivorans TaxID=620903 RepID=UPI002353CB34|nr:hypothetical protein [Negativicoccus succinicivorans]MBS5890570.1 hypothetical protein [Negativicoccus succinicivorans]